MAFIIAKCTNCGASLDVDASNTISTCKYCKTSFALEQAINNYNVDNTNNITDSVVNIYEKTSKDFEIIAGKLIKYSGASSFAKIPDTVTIIGPEAFLDCEGLIGAEIPSSVKHIQGGFRNCRSLKNLVIPSSVISIEEAFFGCTSLESITIPSSVTYIYKAFNECHSLKNVNIPDSITNINDAFNGCYSLKILTIPSSVTNIKSSFTRCNSLVNLNIPSGVTSIDEAFGGCTSLESLLLPSSVSLVTSWAFNECANLKSVHIPNPLVEVSSGAFSKCTSLENVVVNKERTHIELGAFSDTPFSEKINIAKNKEIADNERMTCAKNMVITAIFIICQIILIAFGDMIDEATNLGAVLIGAVALPYAININFCFKKDFNFITMLHIITIIIMCIIIMDTFFMKVVGSIFYLIPLLITSKLMKYFSHRN